MSTTAKIDKINSLTASYRFRLGAILASDMRVGQHWATKVA